MAHTVYYDCGNTNTRLYLLKEDLSLVTQIKARYGVKEVAMGADRSEWIRTLYGMYTEALRETGLRDGDIGGIWASGMATSGFGFQDIPHVCVPVSFEAFSEQVVRVHAPFFKRDVFLIPGLKTQGSKAEEIHHVRGEETEALGLAARGAVPNGQETAVILPGSHTQAVFYRNGWFTDLLSTFTGELYAALRFGTSLAGVMPEQDPADPDPEMLRRGMENVQRHGFNRAVYMTLTMGRFELLPSEKRAAYLQGAVLGDFVQALQERVRDHHPDLGRLVIAGDPKIGRIYQILLEGSSLLPPAELLPADAENPWALEGMRMLLQHRAAL